MRTGVEVIFNGSPSQITNELFMSGILNQRAGVDVIAANHLFQSKPLPTAFPACCVSVPTPWSPNAERFVIA